MAAMPSVLDDSHHARLIADQERVCSVAGIQRKYLQESMTVYCSPIEVDWVKGFRRYEEIGLPGILLINAPHPDAHCQAICGALLRNYFDARVMPLNTVLDGHEQGMDMTIPHILLIPNLFTELVGKSMPAWKIQSIYDLLLARSVKNKASVLCIEDLGKIAKAYGKPFADFLSGYTPVVFKDKKD